jgi:hypothetical protein
MSTRLIFSILSILILSQSALALTAGQEGNGGDAVRLDILSIRNYIYSNCHNWKILKQAGVSCDTLQEKIDEVGVGSEHLRIEDVVDLGDGVSRTGRNRPWIPDVTFSRTAWAAFQGDSAAKIGIVLHEYLGLLLVELTDDYSLSNRVVLELRSDLPSAVQSRGSPATSNKGASDVTSSTIVKARQLVAQAKNCRVNISNDQRCSRAADGLMMVEAQGITGPIKDELRDVMGAIALASFNLGGQTPYCQSEYR